MTMLIKIPAAIIFLGLLIFVHESGHFLVAKAFGVRVLTYSFGFGRRLFGFRHRGTDYRLSLIPFGGYVRLFGADPFDEQDDGWEAPRERGEWSLGDVHVAKRLAIYAAGPLANLVVPFLLFAVLLMAGEPQLAAVVGTVVRDSPAEQAGVQPGDRLLSVAGAEVLTWSDMVEAWPADQELASRVTIVVERLGEQRELALTTPGGEDPPTHPGDFGLRLEVPSAQVGVVHAASPAARAGMQTGDLLLSVAGEAVADWPQAVSLLRRAGDRVPASWLRGQEELQGELVSGTAWIPTEAAGLFDDLPLERWGLQSATVFVASVSPDSAAAQAGVEEGDFLLAIEGQRIRNWYELLRSVAATLVEDGDQRSATPLRLTVMHQGAVLVYKLAPQVIEDTDALGRYYWRPIIGVSRLGGWAEGPTVRVYYGLVPAVLRAGTETVLLVRFTLEQIGRIITGEVAPQESLGGPVEIMRQATKAADRGWFDVARLLGMISISVGIFNLLPVPVLDGGHLLFYSLEAIRGRPVSPLLRERAQIVGVMLLVALMIFVLVVDMGRLFGGAG